MTSSSRRAIPPSLRPAGRWAVMSGTAVSTAKMARRTRLRRHPKPRRQIRHQLPRRRTRTRTPTTAASRTASVMATTRTSQATGRDWATISTSTTPTRTGMGLVGAMRPRRQPAPRLRRPAGLAIQARKTAEAGPRSNGWLHRSRETTSRLRPKPPC